MVGLEIHSSKFKVQGSKFKRVIRYVNKSKSDWAECPCKWLYDKGKAVEIGGRDVRRG